MARYEAPIGRIGVTGPAYMPVKRGVDLLAVALLLIPCLVVMAIVGMAIRVDSPGPIVFTGPGSTAGGSACSSSARWSATPRR
jgi:lipopolysaccharide/colanic/teichoic acid biosynthesis glycosyltransferase